MVHLMGLEPVPVRRKWVGQGGEYWNSDGLNFLVGLLAERVLLDFSLLCFTLLSSCLSVCLSALLSYPTRYYEEKAMNESDDCHEI